MNKGKATLLILTVLFGFTNTYGVHKSFGIGRKKKRPVKSVNYSFATNAIAPGKWIVVSYTIPVTVDGRIVGYIEGYENRLADFSPTTYHYMAPDGTTPFDFPIDEIELKRQENICEQRLNIFRKLHPYYLLPERKGDLYGYAPYSRDNDFFIRKGKKKYYLWMYSQQEKETTALFFAKEALAGRILRLQREGVISSFVYC